MKKFLYPADIAINLFIAVNYGNRSLKYQGYLLCSKLSLSVRIASSVVILKRAIRKLNLEALMDCDDCKNSFVYRTQRLGIQ